jgi:hypothetical protein
MRPEGRGEMSRSRRSWPVSSKRARRSLATSRPAVISPTRGTSTSWPVRPRLGSVGRSGRAIGRLDRCGSRLRRPRVGRALEHNLGMVLLLAPVARAALVDRPGGDLRAAIGDVLAATTVDDARHVYAAIRRAAPGAGAGTGPGCRGRTDAVAARRHAACRPPGRNRARMRLWLRGHIPRSGCRRLMRHGATDSRGTTR